MHTIVYLCSVGLGSFVFLSLFPPTRGLFSAVRDNYGSCIVAKRDGVIALGGTLLGMGMTISGAVSPLTIPLAATSTRSWNCILYSCQMCVCVRARGSLLCFYPIQCPGMVTIQFGAGTSNACKNIMAN